MFSATIRPLYAGSVSVLVGSLIVHALPGDSKNSVRIATVLAAIIVAMWNFTGQRLYAFRSGKRK